VLVRFLHRSLRARLHDQRAELSALVGHLRRGDVAVDVGANKGSYLLWLSRAVGATGRVVAFEPQARLAARLAELTRLARLGNVDVVAKAVGDKLCTAELYVPDALPDPPGASLSRNAVADEACTAVSVEVTTLDHFLRNEDRPIRALKIDVEGHERAVLSGARSILATHAPLVVMECEARHLAGVSVLDVLAELRELGYDGHFVQRGRLVPLSEFDPAVHQAALGERYWDRREYCNNFVLTRSRSEPPHVTRPT
jgi:FkbM family methyltransferase